MQRPHRPFIDSVSFSEKGLQGFYWTQFTLFPKQCWTSGLRLNTRYYFKLLTFVPTIISLTLLPIFPVFWDSVHTFYKETFPGSQRPPASCPTSPSILPHQPQLPGWRQVTFFFFFWFLLFVKMIYVSACHIKMCISRFPVIVCMNI